MCRVIGRWVGVAWLLVPFLSGGGSFSIPAVAQLPPEDKLPWSQTPAAQLPEEHVVPGDRPSDPRLPGENIVPGQRENPKGDRDENELAPIGGETPILRLAFDGHTGTILTLDTSDGGRTMITAGEDKEVHVWRRTDIGRTGWLHRRTIRWPVLPRGPRGRIYTARLKDDLVAFAGYGTFGSLGEIRIADVASGNLIQPTLVKDRDAHRQNILSVVWSPAKEMRLASLDMEGRVLTWQRDPDSGLPTVDIVFAGDAEYAQEYGEGITAELSRSRDFGAICFAGPDHLIVPHYVGPAAEPKGEPKWHLRRYDLGGGQPTILDDLDHIFQVRALTATEDGRVLASCDGYLSVGVWTFDADAKTTAAKKINLNFFPMSLDLDPSGKRLLVGTQLHPDAKYGARLQLWDVEADPPRKLSEQVMQNHVPAVALDLERREAIAAQGKDIQIYTFDEAGQFTKQPAKTLTVPLQPVQRVAFEKEGHRIGLGWDTDQEGKTQIERVFDLGESKLLGRGPIDPNGYIDPQPTAVRWQYQLFNSDDGTRARLVEADQPRGVLPLTPILHGLPTALCTLPVPSQGNEEPDEKPATGAVIVGTDGQDNIYAYKPSDADPPELIRQFRGHGGTVLSLATSADGRYLVSAANDSLLAVWNLQDLFTASKSTNRWGAEFEIEGDRLIATNVREDGPLYFRGVRSGDQLKSLSWRDNAGEKFDKSDPAEMRQALIDFQFDLMPVFNFERFGGQGPLFQSYPAWRPLAFLFVDQSREWAFWTPAGYYDASFNGHQRFGWQITNDSSRSREVDFYRAAQFSKRLERGDVMRRLLSAGSLPAAMRQSISHIGPPPAEAAIVNQIDSKPTIRLLSPDPRQPIQGDTLAVRAAIEVPAGATLVNPKAFVSGVPAVSSSIVANRPNDDGSGSTTVTYQWQFRLPSDKQLQLEVLAATEAESIDRVLVDLQREPMDKPPGKPRLHVLAIGASKYIDPQIQSLDFAAAAAGKVVELFRSSSSTIYNISGDELINADATRPLWRAFAQSAADQLRESVSPDDLVIMYLCGHGLRDRRTNQWYFVTADARYSDLMDDQYDDCIAFSDLAALAGLPCRKLAILDSCHSGAVQPLMRPDDLKSALRFLQDDVVLTMTASEGDEEAAEERETQLGRFTAALVSALGGEAPELDGDPDTVSLGEAIDYVSRRVATESEQEGMAQHPTASPNYLLRTLQLPLTSRPSRPQTP